ncbi:BglG family transcription antiterminator [Catenisphaera adipataccumulans]|uniref:Transcriptional antiterminator/mannitol/fructose-specific phosphotransferase system IIA component n=1 Tax=Catenisphaera adipataccumulans TaxID=700500 RepID=A0A7W8FXA8_9FIRM|nr:PTS sugar transporter subunit IIA [Catenisphaera adipataccumulans]MBB5182767.1 transcriptional antiterminator/mannitol/fructose-specific phosphotransferase system IIA component [Catenisphaera adipataccumulans]
MINKRSMEIIQTIIDQERYHKPCTLELLKEQYKVSERTLRYDLDNISEFLEQQGCKALGYDNDGSIRLNNPIYTVQKAVSQLDFYSMKLTKDERCAVIAYDLAAADQPLTMQKLADSLYVSRSTILHDMDETKKIVSDFDLKLESSKKGLYLTGCESDRRILMMNFYQKAELRQMDQRQTADEQMIDQIVREEIRSIEKQDSLFFTDESYSDLLTYIFIMQEEIKKDRLVEIDYVLRHPSMDAIASEILKKITDALHLKYILTEEYLLSDILYNLNYLRRNDIDENLMRIQIAADEFINAVAVDLNQHIYRDFQFYQNLINHLQSTFKDIPMASDSDDHLLQRGVTDNPEVEAAVRKNLPILEEIVKRSLTNDEIAYITIHVCAAIERSKQRENSLSVLLVTNGGGSAAELLLMKLKRYFRFHVLDVIPEHIVGIYDLSQVDLIITTVPLDVTECETVLLHPYLSDEDCILLGERIETIQSRKKNGAHNRTFLRLENIIANSIVRSSLNKDEIYVNIISDLRNVFVPEMKDQMALCNLLQGHIQVDVEADTWEEAVQKSAAPLLKEGYFNSIYVEQMIQSVYTNGPYIVIGPHFALPHGTPNRGQKLALNLIRLKHPVTFGAKAFDPVYFVCCMSTQDKESHLKPMFHIMSLLRDKECLQALIEAKDAAEIMRILFDYEQML